MKVRTLLCARGIAIDVRTGSVTVFSILEELSPIAFPATVPELSVLASFERAADEPEGIALQLEVSMNGEVFFANPLELSFQGRLIARCVMDMKGMPLMAPGSLVFRVVDDSGKEFGRYVINVPDPKDGTQKHFRFQKAAETGGQRRFAFK